MYLLHSFALVAVSQAPCFFVSTFSFRRGCDHSTFFFGGEGHYSFPPSLFPFFPPPLAPFDVVRCMLVSVSVKTLPSILYLCLLSPPLHFCTYFLNRFYLFIYIFFTVLWDPFLFLFFYLYSIIIF